MKTRKTHSVAFKAQVVEQVLREDKTLAQIAAEHSVNSNQISQWKATGLRSQAQILLVSRASLYYQNRKAV